MSSAAMEGATVEVEILGEGVLEELALEEAKARRLCTLAAASAGVEEGHLAIAFVDGEQIAALNAEHRGKPAPTDVLSFPIDEAQALDGVPRELGDVVICPEHTADLYEAIVHGVLHLVGMDHERDAGEMLALQAELLRWETL
ncbi:MAG TPA: rRNA maturation RNase YbeY [Solirubrobacteraceae bacterium]